MKTRTIPSASGQRIIDQGGYSIPELFRRFAPYYRPYLPALVRDLACAALTTLCELILPVIIRQITNTGMYDFASLTVPYILRFALLYFLLRIVDTLANFYMADGGHVMGARIETDMRRAAYAHLQQLSDRYYTNTKVGQIMGRITNDLFDVTEFSHHCPEEFFIAFVKLVVSFVILARINLALTAIIFAIVPVMLVVCVRINRWQRSAFRRQRVQIGELNARVEDSLLGQRVVKAFAAEELEKEKFEKDNRRFLEIKRDTYLYMGIFKVATLVFEGIMYLAVIIGGGMFMLKGLIQPPDLVIFVLYVNMLIATIRRVVEFTEQFQRGMTGIERFLEIMDADVEIFDREDAVEMKDPRGDIELKDVSFEYEDEHKKVLHHLNLTVRCGERVALVGPSGGGKTTLCNLIPRFYDVSSGSLTIDGRDVRDYTLKSLRKNIGIVQQEVYLFSGSVYENILYGNPDASREQVIEAAKKAGADSFVQELPDGYDTYIGERGIKLSGGQKQRISIARVFLKDPAIIILDEATSSLDNESEYDVVLALRELARGRTSITVAHRLSTIQGADRIYVLTENGIEESGTHQELMEKGGIYANLHDLASRLK